MYVTGINNDKLYIYISLEIIMINIVPYDTCYKGKVWGAEVESNRGVSLVRKVTLRR